MTDKFDKIDWKLTSWEGSRSEQFRRWANLTFDEILQAQEEMAEVAESFGHDIYPENPAQAVGEPPAFYKNPVPKPSEEQLPPKHASRPDEPDPPGSSLIR